jgi:hypothetical protein
MPSTGTPSSNTACGARGVSDSVTLAGPPDRMIARGGAALASASSALLKGTISQ